MGEPPLLRDEMRARLPLSAPPFRRVFLGGSTLPIERYTTVVDFSHTTQETDPRAYCSAHAPGALSAPGSLPGTRGMREAAYRAKGDRFGCHMTMPLQPGPFDGAWDCT